MKKKERKLEEERMKAEAAKANEQNKKMQQFHIEWQKGRA